MTKLPTITGYDRDRGIRELPDGKVVVAPDHRVFNGGPTVEQPERPYCKPDQSCCDFCCGN